MRDLASVVTVEAEQPLFEKTKIKCVSFKEIGYEAIVPIEVKVGDLMIFIQEGAILPEKPCWEFLRKRCWNATANGFIIKPMVMGAKQLPDGTKGDRMKSWGLAVGLNEAGLTEGEIRRLKSGVDLTDALEIRKWEPQEDASPREPSKKAWPPIIKLCFKVPFLRWVGELYKKAHTNASGGFPTEFIDKSDETTIQNSKSFIEKFADSPIYVTQKMEGQSTLATDYKDGKKHRFYVCSRNNAYKNRVNNDFWLTADRLGIAKKLEQLERKTGLYYFIQGEQCGPGIQNNIYNLKETDWYVYTVKVLDPKSMECKQLSWKALTEVCDTLGLKTVPFVGTWPHFSDIAPDLDTLVKFAESQYWKLLPDGTVDWCYKPQPGEKLWKDYMQHEGIVIRSLEYDKKKGIGFSVKVKNCDYSSHNLAEIAKIASGQYLASHIVEVNGKPV